MSFLLFKRVLMICFVTWLVTFSINSMADQALEFKACQIKLNAQAMDAQCATLIRPENPNIDNSKTVNLFVAKLPSTSPSPVSDAFTLIQGGPGGSSIDLAISYSPILDLIRAKRDVIIIDQRGTGRSNKLTCDVDSEDQKAQIFDPQLISQTTQECLTKLADHDLSSYTTSVAVQDLEAMRIAAGYETLNIYGVSYGTRVAQHYLRRFPQSTRTLILDGVVDIGLNLAGAEIARRSQDAFNNMVDRCENNLNCKNKFGDVAAKFKSLRSRLKQESINLSVSHPRTGILQTVTIREADLLATVRLMPYSTEGLSLLPLIISQAYEGNYVTLATQSILGTEVFADFAMGMHNSVMCTEDAPFVDSDASIKAESTYLGSIMIDSMRITCKSWPKGIIDDDFLEPFNSQKPVLILSGATDPITPPANGRRAADMFDNSLHLVVPAHGHGVAVRGCVPFLINDFLLEGSLSAIKPTCIERENSMPFFVDPTGPKP